MNYAFNFLFNSINCKTLWIFPLSRLLCTQRDIALRSQLWYRLNKSKQLSSDWLSCIFKHLEGAAWTHPQ